jgi:hypothetical protein
MPWSGDDVIHDGAEYLLRRAFMLSVRVRATYHPWDALVQLLRRSALWVTTHGTPSQ